MRYLSFLAALALTACSSAADTPGGTDGGVRTGDMNTGNNTPDMRMNNDPPPACADNDGDGYQNQSCNRDARNGGGDCDDNNNLINPGRAENCGNDLDNDCDGRRPAQDQDCGGSCPDMDRDGFEDAECNADPRRGGGDCDDTEASINPDAMERCGNFRDEDCVDGDARCPRPNCTDNDGDGFGEGSGCLGPDCDDTKADVNPWRTEICGDNIDQDCNGADRPCPMNCTDRDFDGFGAGEGCLGPDCNDRNAAINPGAVEVPNNRIDEDCDGRDLELAQDCRDIDEDGYGEGRGCIAEDCDDNDPRVHRNRAEICGNGIDDDCIGGDRACTERQPGECVDMDNDGWGQGACRLGSPDCNDNDPAVNPDATEVCNERDDNCNGTVDECSGRNQVCDGAACVGGAGAACRADGECHQGMGLACNEDVGQCRIPDGDVCNEGAECNPGAECIVLDVCDDQDRRCYQARGGACEESCDCTGDWLCHEENGRCVECVGDIYCDQDARDTCTDGGFCAEAIEIGVGEDDVRHDMFRRMISCWNHWNGHNEVEGCDILFIETALPSGEDIYDDGYACDGDALDAAGFSGDDRDVLAELFGCGLFDVINMWWMNRLEAGTVWCMYYVPNKAGFGIPDDTRPAVVIDQCDVSHFD